MYGFFRLIVFWSLFQHLFFFSKLPNYAAKIKKINKRNAKENSQKSLKTQLAVDEQQLLLNSWHSSNNFLFEMLLVLLFFLFVFIRFRGFVVVDVVVFVDKISVHRWTVVRGGMHGLDTFPHAAYDARRKQNNAYR